MTGGLERLRAHRRLPACGLAVVVSLLPALLGAPPASAGVYSVYECYGDTSASAPDISYTQTDSDFAHTDNSCGGSTGYVSVTTSSGRTITAGGYARWSLVAPPGTALLAGSSVYTRVDEAGGLRGNLYGVHAGSSGLDWSGGAGGDTGGKFQKFTLQSGRSPYSSAFLQLRCAGSSSCQAGSSLRFQKAILNLDDRSAPAVRSLSGPFDGKYHGGDQVIGFNAHDDGAGIHEVEARVNGAIAPTKVYSDCAITSANLAQRLSPCATDRQDSLAILLSALQEGRNTVQLCAHDFENSTAEENVGCSEERTLLFDSLPPANPQALAVDGGSDWRSNNRFDLTWTNEDQGPGAPLNRALYRITGPGGYDSGVRQGPPGEVQRLDQLQVPGPGDYVVRVWLEDAAGNQAEAQSESTHLRFDDTRPADVSAYPARGWISRGEFPHSQSWSRIYAADAPPSGIKGYAVVIDESRDTQPCEEPERCSDAETNFKGPTNTQARIQNLPQGSYWLHVVAVSGAGLRSREVGATELRVDRTDPASTLKGIPSGWTNQPVALSVSGTDALSGMAPDPGHDDGQPLSAIQIDSGPVQTALAPHEVTAGVASEGDHVVRYWSRDLAGNANNGGPGNASPNVAHVLIDRTPPRIAFANSQSYDDLELIHAAVTDSPSGVASGSIAYRPAGTSGPYQELPTELAGGELRARFPSDSSPEGEYEFRATATDVAGNAGNTTARQNGERMVLANPIKVPTDLTATWDTPAANSVCTLRRGGKAKERERQKRLYESCVAAREAGQTVASVPYGAAVAVHGTLGDAAGEPLGGQRVEVVEHFDPGSTLSDRSTNALTDDLGRYSASLQPGPSRAVAVRFAGTKSYAKSAQDRLRENVQGRVTLRAGPARLSNGEFVQFNGTVAFAGATIPPDGKLIQIQYYDSLRRRWRDVNLLESDAGGGFSDSYQFRTVVSPQRFKFRAFARGESGWPFAASASPAATVKVYP